MEEVHRALRIAKRHESSPCPWVPSPDSVVSARWVALNDVPSSGGAIPGKRRLTGDGGNGKVSPSPTDPSGLTGLAKPRGLTGLLPGLTDFPKLLILPKLTLCSRPIRLLLAAVPTPTILSLGPLSPIPKYLISKPPISSATRESLRVCANSGSVTPGPPSLAEPTSLAVCWCKSFGLAADTASLSSPNSVDDG
ncbi:hypothetical protein EW146_g6194 [Bondarzewia mesenterica]|uniref:Uncharacterized protein n=1 Tax=Bondarzewia mesenterica TaxID=1095465 RepID=A0A4S4LPX7_9AGAM|nr:hypothetical protein EW146_g6194 [Bondarzewia mesenterica]